MKKKQKISSRQAYNWLENQLLSLKPRTKVFNLLKAHLNQHGYWKNKPRGDAKKGYLVRNKAYSASNSSDTSNYYVD